jgi:hypothetical protein
MHAYSTDRVMVYLTDQQLWTKDTAGKVETVVHKAGDVAWAKPLVHAAQNLSDKPFEAVIIEVKK